MTGLAAPLAGQYVLPFSTSYDPLRVARGLSGFPSDGDEVIYGLDQIDSATASDQGQGEHLDDGEH